MSLKTLEGLRILLTAFVPGFILLSCSRHWFGYFKSLNEVEIIFWSIVLSLCLNILMSMPSYVLNIHRENPIGTEILAGYSIILFLFLFGIYLKNGKKKFTKILSFISLYLSILIYLFVFIIEGNIDDMINNILWYKLGLWKYELVYIISSFTIFIIITFIISLIITYGIRKIKFKFNKILQ